MQWQKSVTGFVLDYLVEMYRVPSMREDDHTSAIPPTSLRFLRGESNLIAEFAGNMIRFNVILRKRLQTINVGVS